MTAQEIADAVRSRRVSALEVADETLDAVSRLDGTIRAFTAVDPELVRREARRVDARLAQGREGVPLAGVPIGVKDLVDVSGLPSSYGTPAILPRQARTDATCVACLKGAGCVVIGKTRTSELAWRSDTPPTLNPRDPLLTPGGSSGGSAAAVAGSIVPLAIGTDTGGSIRWPAAQCGVVGLKPTTGGVSTAGVLPCSPSLDCVGLLGGTVSDVRLAFEAVTGAPSRRPSPASLAGLRLGLLQDGPFAFVDDTACERFRALTELLVASRAIVVPTELPGVEAATEIAEVVSLVEGRFLGELGAERSELLSSEVREQLAEAQRIPEADVERAQRDRAALTRHAATLFAAKRLDALLLPASTAGAVPRASLETPVLLPDGSSGPAVAWAARAYHLASTTGLPALVVCDPGAPGAGAQLVGRPGEERQLLGLGEALETLLGGRGS